jgi:phosphoglycerol transferase MdoB-like AlkP superfamily enzyme
LCSRYPAFGVPAEAHAATPCAAIAETLKGTGYSTALFHSGRFHYLGMDAIVQNRGFDVLEDAGAIGGNVRSSFGVDEAATVSRILGWIDRRPPGRPFFATYLPIAGHHPYATPKPGPFPVDNDLGRYRNALHYADEALASLLAGLRERQLDQHTLVIVFGDHGEAFEQHPGNMGHTMFIHDENVKVPYLIAGPWATGTHVHRVASLVDTAPTILELLGMPPESAYQGTSLLTPGDRMALFFTDYSLGWLGLRDGCWKYQLEIDADRSKLFEVCHDPDETADLSAGQPARVQAYRMRVTQWSAAQHALVTGKSR